ncbi:GNAT family N-acetyltransferase [Bacillus pinisoli]|uniref:GNAT family N-acetyltransferase n=1 Tax=Bacillus pinisoli TaxID=2901866 RepID=UPI001FF4306C|nr:GNAT family N-acetyltransferase [Bacillus pinisoli]
MKLTFEVIGESQIEYCKDLCNELMSFQKSRAYITPNLFDNMNFETRMIPSVQNATHNYIVIVKDEDKPVAYVYSNISPKEVYSSPFATFFDLNSVEGTHVGCLSQFYIKEEYRNYGIGSKLFNMSMDWLKQYEEVEDYFIYVSNGNDAALNFYLSKGFTKSHDILDGFITVLRSKRL